MTVTAQTDIPSGHKIALRGVAGGNVVRKYAQVIGLSSLAISPGVHVHVHNLEISGGACEHESGTLYVLTSPADALTFDGYWRDDGRLGTRSFIG